jgi:hypothetical protein
MSTTNPGRYLTPQQQEVLALLCEGWEWGQHYFRIPPTAEQIATKLGRTPAAVKQILVRVSEALSVPPSERRDHRRVELAKRAVALGYVMTPHQRAACLLLAREIPDRYAELLGKVQQEYPEFTPE